MELREFQHSSHTHWLAAQHHPQTKASQRVCLANLEEEIFKNAPTRDWIGGNMTWTDKYRLLNRLTLWKKNKKE